MLAGQAPILVIGIGNAYRYDDAAGLAVACRLRAEHLEGVQILEHSGEGGSLLELWQGAAAIILVDHRRGRHSALMRAQLRCLLILLVDARLWTGRSHRAGPHAGHSSSAHDCLRNRRVNFRAGTELSPGGGAIGGRIRHPGTP